MCVNGSLVMIYFYLEKIGLIGVPLFRSISTMPCTQKTQAHLGGGAGGGAEREKHENPILLTLQRLPTFPSAYRFGLNLWQNTMNMGYVLYHGNPYQGDPFKFPTLRCITPHPPHPHTHPLQLLGPPLSTTPMGPPLSTTPHGSPSQHHPPWVPLSAPPPWVPLSAPPPMGPPLSTTPSQHHPPWVPLSAPPPGLIRQHDGPC